jgi:hypothetical protein
VSVPFFVMGCRRSGTTLVSQILDAHSRLASYHESYFYNIFRPELRWYGDLRAGRNLRRLVADAREITRMQGAEPPAPEALMAAMPAPSFPGVLAALLRLYAESKGKSRGGDKTPEHHRYLPEIQRDFPDSPVVFLLRDPRDTVFSIVRNFGQTAMDGALGWNASYVSLRTAVRPVHVVRYEELVTRPEEQVRALCAAVGESYEDGMLAFFERVPESWKTRPGGEKIGKPVDAGSVGSFRKMSRSDIENIEAVCAEGMTELGYQFTTTRSRSPASARTASSNSLSFPKLVFERLRYYGLNRERWRRGMARWRLMLRVRAHYLVTATLGSGREGHG